MNPRPRVLDLFCGVGGAAMGYSRAGFEVEGVDTLPQPDYPFKIYRTGALGILKQDSKSCGPGFLPKFTFIHASPPCQAYSRMTPDNSRHPARIPELRDLLEITRARTGVPWVIENVPGAPLSKRRGHTVMLCGAMFGLKLVRHRLFEFSPDLHGKIWQPPHAKHPADFSRVYGHGGAKGRLSSWQQALGIDWTGSMYSLAQSIPPLFTQFIGEQVLTAIQPSTLPATAREGVLTC